MRDLTDLSRAVAIMQVWVCEVYECFVPLSVCLSGQGGGVLVEVEMRKQRTIFILCVTYLISPYTALCFACLQDDPSTGARVRPEDLFATFQKLTDENLRVRGQVQCDDAALLECAFLWG